jgi:hypothetical protein
MITQTDFKVVKSFMISEETKLHKWTTSKQSKEREKDDFLKHDVNAKEF